MWQQNSCWVCHKFSLKSSFSLISNTGFFNDNHLPLQLFIFLQEITQFMPVEYYSQYKNLGEYIELHDFRR